MSDTQNFGFGKFVPGFDFLQNLAKGATQSIPQMPNLANWVAPTLNVEELEKRIEELKAVHFWLDQNSKALSATIQALEVQKMTLATLKGMNFNMGDVANALKLKAADTMAAGVQMAGETAAETARAVGGAAQRATGKKAADDAPAGGVVDPLQWWGALTQQFQQIAASAMQDAAQKTAVDAARNMATGVAKDALKTATGMAKAATARSSAAPRSPGSAGSRGSAAPKRAARKAAPRKAAGGGKA